MFIRTKKMANGTTKVQIVKSIRKGKKISQRVIQHVGTAKTPDDIEDLKVLAKIRKARLEEASTRVMRLFSPLQLEDFQFQHETADEEQKRLGIDIGHCMEEARVSTGVRQAFGEVYHCFGWDKLFGSRRMYANRAMKEVVLARISEPQSKRATVTGLNEKSQLALNLDYVYRCMDLLDDTKVEEIQQRSYEIAKSLLPAEVTAIFYDVTSLYFESEQEDTLRCKGFSKDGKHHRVQVLFALLITPEGLPVGYEIFPGNVHEAHTLIGVLDALETRLNGVKITVVADAGLINKANEKALQERGTAYILGARIKNQSAAITREILDLDSYSSWGYKEYGASISKYLCITDDERKLIVTYSPKRARKEEHKRQSKIDKIRKKLAQSASPASLSSRSEKQYLDYPSGKVTLSEAKIAAQAQWDGLRGIITWNCDNLDPRQSVIQYRRLSTIEACFRTNKHDLAMRPIFHWKPHRIRAHIAICYMAFCCLSYLQRCLNLNQTPMSPNLIINSLNQLSIGIIKGKNDDRTFCMPTNPNSRAKAIYKVLGLKWKRTTYVYKERKNTRK